MPSVERNSTESLSIRAHFPFLVSLLLIKEKQLWVRFGTVDIYIFSHTSYPSKGFPINEKGENHFIESLAKYKIEPTSDYRCKPLGCWYQKKIYLWQLTLTFPGKIVSTKLAYYWFLDWKSSPYWLSSSNTSFSFFLLSFISAVNYVCSYWVCNYELWLRFLNVAGSYYFKITSFF